ncbi:MAG TPA: ATP-binding protein [Actinomycetota bacterium]|nr:ATP-binding protein [Actinomycetota bacterium]
MSTHPSHVRGWFAPSILLLVAGGVIAAYVIQLDRIREVEGLAAGIVAGACLLSAVVILSVTRHENAWRSSRWLGLGLLGLAVVTGAVGLSEALGTETIPPTPYDGVLLVVALLLLVPAGQEFRGHVPREDRREIAADVVLITIALGTALYLFLRPGEAEPAISASAAEFAVVIAAVLSAYGALAMWVPTLPHAGLFLVMCGLAVAFLIFGDAWLRGSYRSGVPEVELSAALASLLAAFLVATVRPEPQATPRRPARYSRVLLTTLSVSTACGALGLVATLEIDARVGPVQASALIAVLAAGIVLRILVNQVRGAHAQRAVHDALDQKEMALRETDKALARLQHANQTLRESEERLRTVFEAAVDGIVELNEIDVIVRANGAFCRMIELPHSLVEGQPWSALAVSIEADESFTSLPVTGQGTLRREGNPVYLEARTSEIPGDPPRRLLLVRDVTAARVADQTIRSLFKFLQDRDEDRTRIMRRTNAAIESERNRIARDLHDGPVQGVSAASLSLEAVLLMLKAGEQEEGIEVLSKVRRELSEEADNLRRLMSGLRPPLLEERGLIPALRETVDKYGVDNGVKSEFVGRAVVDIPQDLETLAYRIVQEALSNSTKHAQARRVSVSVEAVGGQLRIEVTDDGMGFDAGKAREYLQMGRVGLASMRERVELANGTFMVHSTPGKGTTVLATLPLDAVPAQRAFSVSEAS